MLVTIGDSPLIKSGIFYDHETVWEITFLVGTSEDLQTFESKAVSLIELDD